MDLSNVEDLMFDADALVSLFEMIVRGLVFHHWQDYLPPEFGVKARALPRDIAMPALDLFRVANHGGHVTGNIGDGAFLYQGIRTADNPNASLWRFRIMGGIRLRASDGDETALDEFLVGTLRREFWERLDARSDATTRSNV